MLSVVSPVVLARMMHHFSARPPALARLPPGFAYLSGRESEIPVLIGAGRTNTEIAEELFISMATVQPHVRHIVAKLQFRDRAQAVLAVRDVGLEPRRPM
ncbi:helix-turn-helix transcriptional regulator [Nocardia vinacea]|uniref:response regulator transcription factor n=1 Tax=Nocardia vinacea TaxID=96468 RepID=UPI0033E7B6FA